MLLLTKSAVGHLKAAITTKGTGKCTGIRIVRGIADTQAGTMAIGVTIMAEPDPSDLEFEQEGLRVCVERALIEPLSSRTLDVRESSSGRELVFR